LDSVCTASGVIEHVDRFILNNEEEALIKFHVKWELAVEGNGAGNGLRIKTASC
jgi:hypothetical protein